MTHALREDIKHMTLLRYSDIDDRFAFTQDELTKFWQKVICTNITHNINNNFLF